MARGLVVTEETACGIGFLRGPTLQRLATKEVYVFLYGLLGCVFSASSTYFHGTITTIEKRFRIPSRTTGVIMVGNDISTLMVSALLSYYAGRGHRPRWIALGIYTVVVYCLISCLPHFIWGPGEDALQLTVEYGESDNSSQKVDETLCQVGEGAGAKCHLSEGNLAPQLLLFLAQFIAGIGGSLYFTLGVSYMDDNIKKSKTPVLISFSYFIRMLGPSLGLGLASWCLRLYISPDLTPRINQKDPRWLGAWWIGWLVLAVVMFMFASMLGMFPKTLPDAAKRRQQQEEKGLAEPDHAEMPASWADMVTTFKRLMRNKTLWCNNFAAVFYFFGYMPYWLFMPKYIETMYKQSASASNIITGSVGLVFSALGILLSGLVISRYKPRARPLALWNVLVGAVSVLGIVSYAYLGCDANAHLVGDLQLEALQPCNRDCNCEYIKYTPVCGNGVTYISPCHAGCTVKTKNSTLDKATTIFTDCACLGDGVTVPNVATEGACPVDCSLKFYIFLAVVCVLKFSGATGRASNFLVTVRCVEEKDKPVAMGLSLMVMSMFAFIPSPIVFGYIIDTTCLVWGKTCSGTGNCWLYNGDTLRYVMNFTAAVFVAIGTLFDFGVWFYVKHLKIFDEETEMKEVKEKEPTENEVKENNHT